MPNKSPLFCSIALALLGPQIAAAQDMFDAPNGANQNAPASLQSTQPSWPTCPADLMRRAFESVTSDIAAIDMIMIETELHKLCTERASLIKTVIDSEAAITKSVNMLRAAQDNAQAAPSATNAASTDKKRPLTQEQITAMIEAGIQSRLSSLQLEAAASEQNTIASQTTPPAGAADNAKNASKTTGTSLNAQVVGSQAKEAVASDQTTATTETCPTPRPIEQVYWVGIGRGVSSPEWTITLVDRFEYETALAANSSDPNAPRRNVNVGDDYKGVAIIDVNMGEGFEPSVVTAQDCAGVAEIANAPAASSSYPDLIALDANGAPKQWQGGIRVFGAGRTNTSLGQAKIPAENQITDAGEDQ